MKIDCCSTMHEQLNYSCDEHKNQCPDVIISKSSDGKYFLHAKNADYIANFCPWCGKSLKKIRRGIKREK